MPKATSGQFATAGIRTTSGNVNLIRGNTIYDPAGYSFVLGKYPQFLPQPTPVPRPIAPPSYAPLPGAAPGVAIGQKTAVNQPAKAPVKISSFAASRLRWDTLNGSGPVNRTAFVQAHGNDAVHDHDWVFGKPQRLV